MMRGVLGVVVPRGDALICQESDMTYTQSNLTKLVVTFVVNLL